MLNLINNIGMTSHYRGQRSQTHSLAAHGSKQHFVHDYKTSFLYYKSSITQITHVISVYHFTRNLIMKPEGRCQILRK